MTIEHANSGKSARKLASEPSWRDQRSWGYSDLAILSILAGLIPLLVFVPIAPVRRRERGYNQAALLAREIVEPVGGVLDEGILERVDRPAQVTLSADARLSNLSCAIEVRRAVHEERVLLVDDVATTGATLSACATALVNAGAQNVRALVFARDL